jgi:hypothetical protein
VRDRVRERVRERDRHTRTLRRSIRGEQTYLQCRFRPEPQCVEEFESVDPALHVPAVDPHIRLQGCHVGEGWVVWCVI